MPKFSDEVNQKTIEMCRKVYGLGTWIPRPQMKFAKTKKAAGYVENGFKLFSHAMVELEEKGLPCTIEMGKGGSALFKECLWNPLGVTCTVDGDTATLYPLDEAGAIPQYLAARRAAAETRQQEVLKVQAARDKIAAAYDEFEKTVLEHAGTALVATITLPRIYYLETDRPEYPPSAGSVLYMRTRVRGGVGLTPHNQYETTLRWSDLQQPQ